jgi:hypothetical protein
MSSLMAAASAKVHATRRFLRVVPCPAQRLPGREGRRGGLARCYHPAA